MNIVMIRLVEDTVDAAKSLRHTQMLQPKTSYLD
jgi:hypothetical protein